MTIQSMPCYCKLVVKEEKLSKEKSRQNSPLEQVVSCMMPQQANKMAHIKT